MKNLILGIFQSFILSLFVFIMLPSSILGFTASRSSNILLFMTSVLIIGLVDVSANMLNNYADWNIDILNKKRKELHHGITKNILLYLYISFTLLLFVLMFILKASIYLFTSTILFVIAGIIYSLFFKLKDIAPLNYITIGISYGALSFSIGFFSGSSSLMSYTLWIPLIIFLSLATFAHTITKDYGDLKGDAKSGKRTFPVMFGKRGTVKIQTFLEILSYSFLVLLVLLKLLSPWFLLAIASFLIGIYILFIVNNNENVETFKKAALYNKFNHLILRVMLIMAVLLTFNAL